MRQILIWVTFSLTACAVQSNVTSEDYVPKQFNVVASGDNSPEKSKLLVVTFNKHFNQQRYSKDFISKYNLDKIDYSRNMAIEIFMGEQNGDIQNLRIEKIEENKNNIKVHYSFDQLSVTNNETKNPFVIVQILKSRKPVIYFENGVQVKMTESNVYINN